MKGWSLKGVDPRGIWSRRTLIGGLAILAAVFTRKALARSADLRMVTSQGRPAKKPLEEMLGVLATIGIRPRAGVGLDKLRKALDDWGGEVDFAALLIVLGDPDASGEPYSNDVWHFDTECIEDSGAYTGVVNDVLRLAQGELSLEAVRDEIDVQHGKASVGFVFQGAPVEVSLKLEDDWVDTRIFDGLQDLLVRSGSRRRLAWYGLGQDGLWVCQPPETIAQLREATGLGFEVHVAQR